jgi:hypothetical protein
MKSATQAALVNLLTSLEQTNGPALQPLVEFCEDQHVKPDILIDFLSPTLLDRLRADQKAYVAHTPPRRPAYRVAPHGDLEEQELTMFNRSFKLAWKRV